MFLVLRFYPRRLKMLKQFSSYFSLCASCRKKLKTPRIFDSRSGCRILPNTVQPMAPSILGRHTPICTCGCLGAPCQPQFLHSIKIGEVFRSIIVNLPGRQHSEPSQEQLGSAIQCDSHLSSGIPNSPGCVPQSGSHPRGCGLTT